MKKSVGIVLKKYFPQKKTISMLDKQYGKITVIPQTEDISTGALLSYTLANKHSPYFIRNIELLSIPFKIARDDILFLHHILELCHYSLPHDTPAEDIFNMIILLYSFPKRIKYKIDKKIFLFKLFMIFGIYPETMIFHKPCLYRLASESIDTILEKNLHLGIDKELDMWLHSCIQMHPCVKCFKTIHFLKER